MPPAFSAPSTVLVVSLTRAAIFSRVSCTNFFWLIDARAMSAIPRAILVSFTESKSCVDVQVAQHGEHPLLNEPDQCIVDGVVVVGRLGDDRARLLGRKFYRSEFTLELLPVIGNGRFADLVAF